MLLARVLGNSWGARRAPSLDGERLLVVRPLSLEAPSGGPLTVSADHQPLRPVPRTMVVVDRLGAGPGELVLVAHGSRCRDLTLGPAAATKEVVLAIVDRAEISAPPRRAGEER